MLRLARLLLCCVGIAGGCCGLPPRIDDQTTPVRAYETFRGALARKEYDREYRTFSAGLDRRFGIKSPVEWARIRAVALQQGDLLVRGIRCSEVKSVERLPHGRALLHLDFPLGRTGTVTLVEEAWLVGYVKGMDHPWILQPLPAVDVKIAPDGLLLPLDPQKLQGVSLALEGKDLVRIQEATLWFLDDFAAGDETPESIRERSAPPPAAQKP